MKTTKAIGMLVLGMCSATFAGGTDADLRSELEALKAQVKAQSGEINQLRAANGDTWLNERRAEEVKALVKEVLSDADTRASLAEGGATAGHKNGHFFLASEDGNFLLQLSGQVQFRYIWGNNDDVGPGDRESHEGFQNRRTMIAFSGHLFDPKFTYKISILATDTEDDAVSQGDSEFAVQNAWFAYEFADGWQVKGGQFKAPFARDEMVHSSRQLAVERAQVTELFTVDYTQGVQVGYSSDMVRVMAMLHDGSRNANSDYTSSEAEFAIAARVEILVAGSWKQFEDYATWSKDKFGLLVGAAVDYENAEGETSGTANDILRWTLDVSAEFPELMGLNAFAALYGTHPESREGATNEPDQFGIIVQAGLFVIPDKMDIFARWEYLDLDNNFFESTSAMGSSVDDVLNTLTFGSNYYFHGHRAKATVDVVWYLDSTSTPLSSNTGTALLTSDEDNEVAIRAQFQFLF